MKAKILLFAILKERYRSDSVAVDLLPGETVRQVAHRVLDTVFDRNLLENHLMFAVNDHYVDANYIPGEDDEIAVIPPVAGG